MFPNSHSTIDISKAFPSYLSWLFVGSNFTRSSSVLVVSIIVFVVLAVAVTILLFFLRLKKTINEAYVYLEVRPTDVTLKSALSTNQLFTLLHSLGKRQSWFEKIIGLKRNISFELVSTKHMGIRYILRIPQSDVSTIKKSLMAYLPGVETNEVADYLLDIILNVNSLQEIGVKELKLKNNSYSI
jgi:hypothetical protein